jgi:hypothetical protein
MDSSTLTGQNNFRAEKDYLKSLTKVLNIRPGNSRAATVTYGDKPRLVNKFDGYSTVKELENLIDSAPFVGGPRRIDRALEFASSVLTEGRENVPRITVLLTSGRQAPSSNGKSLELSAQPLKDRGSNTYIIAMGGDHDRAELNRVVNKTTDVFFVSSFNQLQTNIRPTARQIANNSGEFAQRKYNKLDFKLLHFRVSRFV